MDLEQLAALEAEATPGPWRSLTEGIAAWVEYEADWTQDGWQELFEMTEVATESTPDAALIAEARNALPDLIASARRAGELEAENERLRTALIKLNRLRSNVVATQNASWSNMMYPLVAILDEAGYGVQGATEEQKKEHLACYGGAGKTPRLLDESVRQPWNGQKSSPQVPDISGAVQIHAERYRQQHEEGWTPEHDDAHTRGELEWAARAYAAVARFRPSVAFNMRDQVGWPWAAEWFKPTDRISNLVKAGALIAAEIDRLQRAATGWSVHTEERDDG